MGEDGLKVGKSIDTSRRRRKCRAMLRGFKMGTARAGLSAAGLSVAGLSAARLCAAALTFSVVTVLMPPLLASPAQARDGGDNGDSDRREMEQQRQEMRRAQQEAREQQRQAREAEKAAREQQRQIQEQQRQAREDAREQQRQAKEQAAQAQAQAQAQSSANDTPGRSSSSEASSGLGSGWRAQAATDRSGGGGSSSSASSRTDSESSGSNGARQQRSDDSGDSRQSSRSNNRDDNSDAKNDSAKNSKDDKSKDDKSDDPSSDDGALSDDNDDVVPTTMVGVFNKLFGGGSSSKAPSTASKSNAGKGNAGKGNAGKDNRGQGQASAGKDWTPQLTKLQPAAASRKPVAATKPNTAAGSGSGATATAATSKSNTSTATTSTGNKVTASSKKPARGGTPPPLDELVLEHNDVLAVNASAATLAKAIAQGFKSAEQNRLPGLDVTISRLILPPGMTPEAANRKLAEFAAADGGGSFADNRRYRIYKTATGSKPGSPDDAAVPQEAAGPACAGDRCYGRDLVGWSDTLQSCAKAVSVGIIDTSVDVTHPAFATALQHKSIEIRHLAKATTAKSPDWHGTGVLALLAGAENSPTPGLIPNAKFYVADAFFSDADGEPATDTVGLMKALEWLQEKNVRVVNLSLSGPADDLVRAAIDKMAAKGAIFVAAAGNDGPRGSPSYPAAYAPVIAVTAVNSNLSSYVHATQGSYVDVAAPGVKIWTALPGARQGYHSGTSFAAPYVTAAVATLYRSLPNKSKDAVLQKVSYRDLGDPGRDSVYGNGLIRVPDACGSASVASAPAGTLSLPPASPPAPAKPIGFGFQSSSVSSGVEVLPWLSGGQ